MRRAGEHTRRARREWGRERDAPNGFSYTISSPGARAATLARLRRTRQHHSARRSSASARTAAATATAMTIGVWDDPLEEPPAFELEAAPFDAPVATPAVVPESLAVPVCVAERELEGKGLESVVDEEVGGAEVVVFVGELDEELTVANASTLAAVVCGALVDNSGVVVTGAAFGVVVASCCRVVVVPPDSAVIPPPSAEDAAEAGASPDVHCT